MDILALYTPSATAADLAGYRHTALRLLHEPALAAQVISEQLEIVQRLGSPHFFWQQILAAHRQWLNRSSA